VEDYWPSEEESSDKNERLSLDGQKDKEKKENKKEKGIRGVKKKQKR
jgi:hypothetical protein